VARFFSWKNNAALMHFLAQHEPENDDEASYWAGVTAPPNREEGKRHLIASITLVFGPKSTSVTVTVDGVKKKKGKKKPLSKTFKCPAFSLGQASRVAREITIMMDGDDGRTYDVTRKLKQVDGVDQELILTRDDIELVKPEEAEDDEKDEGEDD